MVSFLEGVRNANKAINCFLLSAGGNVLGAVASLPGGSPEFIENTTKALRRLAGCDPADDPPLPTPSFTGGQCAGVAYGASYTWLNSPGAAPQSYTPEANQFFAVNQGQAFGPISNFTRVGTLNSRFNFTAFNSQGQPLTRSLNQGGTATGSTQATITGLTFTRLDGGSECGDPPPVFPPPAPINIDIDVTYNIDDGTEVTVTIPFIYAPITVDINGNFRIPFTFDFGGIEFSGNVQLEPNFNVTINPPPAPRGTDSPFTDLPAPDDEIPVEPAPPDQRIVGVVVQSQLVGEQQLTTILTDDIPQILVPRCGSVKFGYVIGIRSFWSPDIDVKDLNCFIPCPFSQGADTVAASPAPGVVLNYSPIFGYALATVADVSGTSEP